MRFVTFLHSISTQFQFFEEEEAMCRLRAAYLATCRMESSESLVRMLQRRSLVLALASPVCFFLLETSINQFILSSCIVFINLFFFVVIAYFKRRLVVWDTNLMMRRRTSGLCFSLRNWFWAVVKEGYSDGKGAFLTLTAFFVRSFILGVGFTSLSLFDTTIAWKANLQNGLTNIADMDAMKKSFSACIFAFYGVILARDLSMIVPIRSFTLRSFVAGSLQVIMFALALYGKLSFPGFAWIGAILFCINSLNYRDGILYNSELFHHHTATTQSLRLQRASKNVKIIFCMILGLLAASLLIGALVGAKSSVDVELTDGDFIRTSLLKTSLMRKNQLQSPACSIKFSSFELNVVDLAMMSEAAYRDSKTDALQHIRMNPKLKDWTIVNFNFDSSKSNYSNSNDTSNHPTKSGVSFIEFSDPSNTFSVISIRGTHSIKDAYQSLYLWNVVALLQLSSYLGTFISVWPMETVAFMVFMINKYISSPTLIYWEEIQDLVVDVMNRNNTGALFSSTAAITPLPLNFATNQASYGAVREVLLTGHSLGYVTRPFI